MNTIDYTLYSGYPISGCGYIPDKGFMIKTENLDDLLVDERDTGGQESIHINDVDFRILFLQKSMDHKFGRPYLDFLKFCLSMININLDNPGMFFLEPNIMSLKDSDI